MTYRHHLAELKESNESYSIYRYTPDSVAKEHWGLLKIPHTNSRKFEVEHYAEDGGSAKWKESVCMALVGQFELLFKENNGAPPLKIRFAA